MKMRWRHVLYPICGRRIPARPPRLINRIVPLLGWLWYFPAAFFTARVFAFLIFAIFPALWFLGIFGFNAIAPKIGFGAASLMALSCAAGFILRPRLSVRVTGPRSTVCGQDFPILYEVHNVGIHAAYDVRLDTIPFPGAGRISMRHGVVPFLPRGGSCTVTGYGNAKRRGKYELQQFRWDTSFPLGFWRWGKTDWTPRSMVVYPSYSVLEKFSMSFGPREDSDNISDRRTARSAMEFRGCREFNTGDSTRNLHPRSSARAGIPIVKEYQSEGRGRTSIILDTWLRRQPTFSWQYADTPVEAAISLAASVVDRLSKDGRAVELLAAGPEVYRFESSGGTGCLEEALDVLASVEYDTKDNFKQLHPVVSGEICEIRSACLILCGWDKIRAEIYQELLDRNISSKVIIVVPGGKLSSRRRCAGLPADAVIINSRTVLCGEVSEL